MQIFLTLGYLAIFIFLIRRSHFFRIDGLHDSLPSLLFFFKVLAGICLGLVYTYIYTDIKTTDTFKFFNDSKILYRSLFEHPYDFFRMFSGYHASDADLRHYYLEMDSWLNTNMFVNDNRTLIRLNALICVFTVGHYYANVVFMNFLSFTGLMCLFKLFARILKEEKKLLLLTTFFFPSLLFWGSGLLKDGLLIFGLGVFLYSFSKAMENDFRLKNILLLLLGFITLALTKIYVVSILIPLLLAWVISVKAKSKRPAPVFLITSGILFLIAFNIYRIFPEVNLTAALYWKQWNFYEYAKSMQSRSLIQIPKLDFTQLNLIKCALAGFFTTLLRPSLPDINSNPLQLLAIAENLMLLAILALPFVFPNRNRREGKTLLVFSFFFTAFLFMLIGMITPVLGAIVRYKIPAFPFIGFIVLYYTNTKLLSGKLPFLKKYLS